jgi:hypothetical protein
VDESSFKWRILKTLSNAGFVVMILVEILNWHNSSQAESIMYDAEAKAYWLRVRHFYDLLGWISIAMFIGLRLIYWVIEYFYDRRNLAGARGH